MAVSKSNKKILILSGVTLVVLFAYAFLRDMSSPISTKQADTLIKNGSVDRIVTNDETAYLQLKNKQQVRIPADKVQDISADDIVIDSDSSSGVIKWLLRGVVALFIAALFLYILLKQRAFKQLLLEPKVVNQKTNTYEEETNNLVAITSDVIFSDVAGIEDVKDELLEVIEFLKDSSRFERFGVRMPRGLLLVGPPGVGKTMIAKAVAGEAGVPFYYQSASSFVQIYVGMGAKRVRELFMEAKRNAPSIIFIDEIDAVGKARGGSGRNDERDATLNQLLTEMDGFDSSTNVIVIAATNKIDVLDDALLRAGRFDRRIFVEMPTLKEREAIILKYLEKIPNAIDAAEVSRMTVGFSGASLATLINEAALKALRDEKIMLHMSDIEAVKAKVKEGKKRIQVLQSEEKMQQSYYQIAKAVVAYFAKYTFDKCTILHDDIYVDRSLQASKKVLFMELKYHLSGLAMMHLEFDEHFVSAEKELTKAKKLAADMVRRYGMGRDIVGDSEDEKVLLQAALEEVTLFLKENERVIKQLALELQQKEIIYFHTIQESFNDIL